MFENLSHRLSETVDRLRGSGRLTEANIQDALRDVRRALLEADVALPVVKALIERVRARAVGRAVLKSLTPGQALIKVVKDELIDVMGAANETLSLACQPPAVILMAGLQGSGKTTTTGKLAKRLKESDKKSVMVASTDVYRPAAMDQLQTVAAQVGVDCFAAAAGDRPVAIAEAALRQARRQGVDVLIVDTAGRLHVDDALMDEIKALHAVLEPIETLFVVDSMTGQDAVNSAKAFNDALALTGVVLTKTDGDSRGGAALSIRHITGKPIKFLGAGEQLVALEPFHPDRVASRILGMGDVLTLIETAQRQVDQQKAEKLANKIRKGKVFTLADFKEQMEQMNNLGGLGALMGQLPGMNQVSDRVKAQVSDKSVTGMIAIINSMTRQERQFPGVINGSRKKRIAKGSGTQVQDVNRLLKQFTQMQKMMKKVSKGGMDKLLRGMPGRALPRMPF